MKKACAFAQAFEYLVGRDRFELSTYGLRVPFWTLESIGKNYQPIE